MVGDVVGEGALFDQNSKRSATLVATSNVSCFRLLFQDFHRICPTATEDLKIAFLVRVLKAVKRNETGSKLLYVQSTFVHYGNYSNKPALPSVLLFKRPCCSPPPVAALKLLCPKLSGTK